MHSKPVRRTVKYAVAGIALLTVLAAAVTPAIAQRGMMGGPHMGGMMGGPHMGGMMGGPHMGGMMGGPHMGGMMGGPHGGMMGSHMGGMMGPHMFHHGFHHGFFPGFAFYGAPFFYGVTHPMHPILRTTRVIRRHIGSTEARRLDHLPACRV